MALPLNGKEVVVECAAVRSVKFFRLVASIFVCLLLLLSALCFPFTLAGDEPDTEKPPAPAVNGSTGIPSNIQSSLARLILAAEDHGLTRAAGELAVKVVDHEVRVMVDCTGADVPRLVRAFEDLGVAVEGAWRGQIQCLAPPAILLDVADIEGVRTVRLPPRCVECAVTSEGLSVIEADLWHAAGYDGTGVKIGILDSGFEEHEDLLGTELPASVTLWPAGVTGPGASNHGTACAEILHDIAPGADLYLAAFDGSPAHWNEAVDWLIAQDVDIISCSMGWFGSGPRDGNSPICEPIHDARDEGILWAQAAGNSARQHWLGDWTDQTGDGWHEFTAGTNGTTFDVQGGDSVWVYLLWDDEWGTSTNDYNLYIKQGETTVASSVDVQGVDSFDPVEYVAFTASGAATYSIHVEEVSSSTTAEIEIFATHDLDTYVEAGSLVDNAVPASCLTVGAVDWNTPNEIEPYSSRGPTSDDRIKPDLVGPVWVSTSTLGEETLGGTSPAAPHAAGAAALLKHAYPAYGADDLQSSLESAALDLGPLDKDNTFGSGLLQMPGVPEAPSAYDFGDAPDPTYPTLLTSNGARHLLGSPYFLGSGVDGEADGQPGQSAMGDDTSGMDDEDGVVFTSPFTPGEDCTLDVTASEAGYLDAWVDFNQNGDWGDDGEQVFASEELTAGVNHLTFTIPGEASFEPCTYARFRFSSTGGLSYTGEAADGEVEDYCLSNRLLVEGDANLDGKTNIIDAMFIAQYTVGLRELCADALICADTSDDGLVNVVDAMHIAQYTVDPTGDGGILFKPLWEEASDPMTVPPP